MRRWKSKLFVVAVVSALLTGLTIGTAAGADGKTELFDRIRAVYDIVDYWHKDGADANKFAAGAIKGGLDALGDPYTQYFSPQDYRGFLDSLNGTVSGIGAYLEQAGNYVVVSAPIKGSPAELAGLQTGDRLLEANGKPLVGATVEQAVSTIRGEAGTNVVLKVERPSEGRTFTLGITRAIVSIPEVETKMLNGQVGYLQLTAFGDDAAKQFRKGIDSLKQQGAKSLVLDLRQNGGGYVSAAVDIASAFVPAGSPVLWEVTKSDKLATQSYGSLIDLPVVVLVDGGTASASEILAGALQDYGVAPLVGQKTFGKGTVQQILSITGGAGIKVTVAEYLTPLGHHVHHIGLTPDFIVENPKPIPERTALLTLQRPLFPTDAGLDVLYLQYRLQDLGYASETTGYFGIRTVDAAEKFCKDNGLSTEPLISDKFVEALNQKVAERVAHGEKEDLQLKKAMEIAQFKIVH